MIRFSEFVSLGHPDKIADYISQYLLDRYIEQDPQTRYAVEVQIKDNIVTLGGEVSSTAHFTQEEVAAHVGKAVCEIGYTQEYQDRWGKENTISGNDLHVASHISQQSPDIAQGLSGWGDQGIFFGMATPSIETCHMPYEHAVAKRLCKALFDSKLGGLDIKTQVVTDNGNISKVIVAIPLLPSQDSREVEDFVRAQIAGNYNLIINGTGRYVQHGSIADCGTTGRKLAVDFYGGHCKIGGGSPWTKDASKADLTLNLFARELARRYATDGNAYTSLACCIGKQEVDVLVQDGRGNVLNEGMVELNPAVLMERYQLNSPIFASMCRWGLFGEGQKDKIWEQGNI